MSANAERKIQRGYGNAQRPVTRELWARDSRPAIPAMRQSGNIDPDNQQVNFRRYYDEAYFAREIENVWRKQWLFAAREEDMPEVGARVPFDVGPTSFVIVRSAENDFKAFYNSCLHRGTQLCAKPESGETIRCPYHGWEWKVDGSLRNIPSHWDFTAVRPQNGSLRQVKLARWGGFIFINADHDAPPLEEALSVIPEHFKEFRPEERYTAARFRKHVPANWKITQEAFMESYHLLATHPFGVPFNGDTQAQYDIWSSRHGHVGRQVTPSGVPSMHAGPEATAAAAADAFTMTMQQWHYPEAELPKIDPKRDVRAQLGDWHRAAQKQKYGREVTLPDAVMVDSTLYFMFPQATFWLSETLPFTYAFTPHATDPNQSYFDVRMLLPLKKGQRRQSSPIVEVGLDERIQDRVDSFGYLSQIFDQDMSNMPLIQRGARSADPARHHSQLGAYQEAIIQHWNEVLDLCVGA